jgi:hypothetical protein
MGQTASAMGITHGENKWRSNTELQRQRNTMQLVLKRNEKIEFVKWAKTFDADPMGYIRFCQGQYPLPENNIPLQIMALGYISDISEVKRLHNEEDIKVEWTPIPFGITKEEWNDPLSINDTIIDRKGSSGISSDGDNSEEENLQLGTTINLLEEVADESDSEPESEPEPEQVEEIKFAALHGIPETI